MLYDVFLHELGHLQFAHEHDIRAPSVRDGNTRAGVRDVLVRALVARPI
jgi:hypothetical protein